MKKDKIKYFVVFYTIKVLIYKGENKEKSQISKIWQKFFFSKFCAEISALCLVAKNGFWGYIP